VLQRAALSNADKSWPAVADIPAGPVTLRAGQPLWTVFAAGDSEAAVQRRLDRIIHETSCLPRVFGSR